MEIVNIILDIIVYVFAVYGVFCALNKASSKDKKINKEEERKEVK